MGTSAWQEHPFLERVRVCLSVSAVPAVLPFWSPSLPTRVARKASGDSKQLKAGSVAPGRRVICIRHGARVPVGSWRTELVESVRLRRLSPERR